MNILPIILLIILLLLVNQFIITNPDQSDIQSLTYAKSKTADFIYPQISHGFKQLSKGNVKPLNNLKNLLPNNSDTINITRDNGRDTDRFYIPDYFRRDTLPNNNIGSEEMRPFINDDNINENSWTDTNVSEHPKYYTNDFENNFTDTGSFFDKKNQFHDTTSSNTFVLPSDNCYIAKNGETFCRDNTRIQNISPKLISDPDSLSTLELIGIYKDSNCATPDINSESKLFDNVGPSRKLGTNESFAKPLEPMISAF